MKKILAILILFLACLQSHAQVGINSSGGIVPLGPGYAPYYNQFLKGGFKSGWDITARDNYPAYLRDTVNFIFFTSGDSSFWILKGGVTNANWKQVQISNSSSASSLDTTSLSNRINQKLNISDTSNMLMNYVRNQRFLDSLSNIQLRIQTKLNAADTASLSNRIDQKLNLSDTSNMLMNYVRNQRFLDSLSNIQSLIQTKLNAADTAAMLNNYRMNINALISDSSTLQPRFDQKLNTSDTALMLSNYVRKGAIVTFSNDVKVNLGSGKTVGKYTNGQTIPAQGKTIDEVLFDIATETVHPTYSVPAVSITSPSSSNYEIGSTISPITILYNYNQNNGGSISSGGVVYKKNGTALGSNTDNITSLTSAVNYQVTVTYDQGACINNNLGQLDCTGRINAGTVSSNTVTFTPQAKSYFGFMGDVSNIGNAASDNLIRALSGVGFPATKTSSFNSGAVSNAYLVYAYPASMGPLSGLTINNFPALGAMNVVQRNFTNASNYTQSYYIYYSTQAQTTSGYPVTTN